MNIKLGFGIIHTCDKFISSLNDKIMSVHIHNIILLPCTSLA